MKSIPDCRFAIAAALAIAVFGLEYRTCKAQTGGCTKGQTSTTTSTTQASTAAAQLTSASASLQRLLQSGTLTAAQQQQVASLLANLYDAQRGATLSASQVRQINSAVAASTAQAAQQARTLASNSPAALQTGGLSAQGARQTAARLQGSAQVAARGRSR